MVRFLLFAENISSHEQEITEAATETIFENICSFLPGASFSGFFREALCVYRTDTNFPGAHLCVHRTDTDFPGRLI